VPFPHILKLPPPWIYVVFPGSSLLCWGLGAIHFLEYHSVHQLRPMTDLQHLHDVCVQATDETGTSYHGRVCLARMICPHWLARSCMSGPIAQGSRPKYGKVPDHERGCKACLVLRVPDSQTTQPRSLIICRCPLRGENGRRWEFYGRAQCAGFFVYCALVLLYFYRSLDAVRCSPGTPLPTPPDFFPCSPHLRELG